MNRIRTNVVTSILVVCGAAAGAIAQPVYIGGHEYAALGSAVASSSSDGRTLTVHNIGSSGQDGVEIFSASLFGAGLVYTRDGGTPPPPPGSSSSLGIRSSSGAIISTRTSVSNSDTSVTHTFDYAALGAISVRVVRLDEHGVEISNQVFPGPIGEVTMMPPCPIGTPFYPSAKWYDFWQYGTHIMGWYCDDPINPLARVVVTPTFAPGTSPDVSVSSMVVTAADMPEFSISEPGTMFGAAKVTGLGSAIVREQCDDGTACDDAARRRVVASNIGSSGNDGVSLSWGGTQIASTGDFTFDGMSNSHGFGRASMRGVLGGGGGGGAGGEIELSSLSVTDLGNDSSLIVPDFTGVGATEVLVTAYAGGVVVGEILLPVGGGVILTSDQVVCGPNRVPLYGWITEPYWNPWPIQQTIHTYWGVIGCGSLSSGGGNPINYTERIVFTPVNPVPVGEVTGVDLAARDVSGVTVVTETTPNAPCAADVNGDGFIGSQDFFDFLTRFFSGNADMNGDGATTSQDFFDFLVAFFAGC